MIRKLVVLASVVALTAGCPTPEPNPPGPTWNVEEVDNHPSIQPVAVVVADKKKKLKYECGACKPASDRPPLPCVEACKAEAISHSW